MQGVVDTINAAPLWLVVLMKSIILLARRHDDVRVFHVGRTQGAGLDAVASRAESRGTVGPDAAGRRRGQADAEGRSDAGNCRSIDLPAGAVHLAV